MWSNPCFTALGRPPPHLSYFSRQRGVIISNSYDPPARSSATPKEASEDNSTASPFLKSAIRKAYWRALPLLFFCYIIAYIDRTNVSVASLTMALDLPAFDSAVFGFGAGIFFIGYFILEIPGSVIVERWSARKWICRIMVTWGIMAALTAFVRNPIEFYIVRFLLGVAEAGFFPGVIVYLTHWFPARERARAISYFLIASPIAMMIGPAVSRLFLKAGRVELADGTKMPVELWFGLHDWQWIYIFWGIPAVIAGFIVLFYLTDRPKQARWLTTQEQDALESELTHERESKANASHHSIKAALLNPGIILLSIAYFGIVTANYGIEFFMTKILEEWHKLDAPTIAALVIIPSVLVIPGQLFIGWSSDRSRERRWHSALPVVVGSVALFLSTFTNDNLIMTMVCFTVAAAGMKIYMPAFFALPSLFLTSTAAAGSIGMINSIGNLGGFLGPTVMGYVSKFEGGYNYGLYFLAFTSILSAGLISMLKLKQND